MATTLSPIELQKMSLGDLLQEIREHEAQTRKQRIDITMGREKDTARYRRGRRLLARMKTVLTQKQQEETLKKSVKTPTVAVPSKAPKAPRPKAAPNKKTSSRS